MQFSKWMKQPCAIFGACFILSSFAAAPPALAALPAPSESIEHSSSSTVAFAGARRNVTSSTLGCDNACRALAHPTTVCARAYTFVMDPDLTVPQAVQKWIRENGADIRAGLGAGKTLELVASDLRPSPQTEQTPLLPHDCAAR